MVLQQMMGLSTHIFVARKEKTKRRKIQKQFLVEGWGGVQRSFFSIKQAVEFSKVHSWSIECPEYIGHESIMHTMLHLVKSSSCAIGS